MTRMFHLVLVIILTYVCVLNIMIVHVMYNRFLKHRMAPLPVPAPRIPLHLTPPPQRQRVKMTAVCEQRHREIVVRTSAMTNGNDALVHATALPQLRQALRVTSDMIDTCVFGRHYQHVPELTSVMVFCVVHADTAAREL